MWNPNIIYLETDNVDSGYNLRHSEWRVKVDGETKLQKF